MRLAKVLGAIGRTCITAGVLILLFVAYQLWGTGIYEAREQDRLQSEFAQELAREKAEARRNATATTSTTVPAPPPPVGEAVGMLRIPKIGLDRAVVQGINVPDLRKGPGHYPATPMPGQLGNAAIAGHRTTYGAPFNRLDELAIGDPILVTTLAGTYRYKVFQSLVVHPKRGVFVLDPTPTATLTLTTCNPKFSARERLVVQARLDVDRSPKPVKAPPQAVANRSSLDDALSGRGEPRLPTVWWGLLVIAVGAVWWLIFHRYHRWTTWFLGVVPFAIVLAVFYYHLERLLPANY